ncbi:MAG: NRDE family protein, partial [Chitinophagaceae bacterium]
MCTVTFIPTRSGVLLSSNRDESPRRKKALLPMIIKTEDGEMIYPTDGLASGTWVGVHSSGVVMVLLNGAANSFASQTSFLKSRGLVVKQLLNSNNHHNEWHYIDLANVAPFTLVTWQHSSLFELSWNGRDKHCLYKDPGKPHIWSSSTLYDINATKKREQWFTKWLDKN